MPLPTPFDRLRLPVIGSPLFIVSGAELVIRAVQGGIVGAFPLAQRAADRAARRVIPGSPRTLRAQPRQPPSGRPRRSRSPIVHKSTTVDEDIALCAKCKCRWLITSLGARGTSIRAVHAWGGIVLHDVINDRFARKAIEKGADGLIPVAAGAGGHAGGSRRSPSCRSCAHGSTGLIALSGAIANGRAVLAAQALVADFAYIARRGSPPRRPTRPRLQTGHRRGRRRRSSTPTCSLAFTATTCASIKTPGSIPRTFRSATRAR